MPKALDMKAAFLQRRLGVEEILFQGKQDVVKEKLAQEGCNATYDHRSSILKQCYFCWPAVCFSPVFALDGLLGLSFIFIATAMARAVGISIINSFSQRLFFLIV